MNKLQDLQHIYVLQKIGDDLLMTCIPFSSFNTGTKFIKALALLWKKKLMEN